MVSKKAISPVVATALLLVVAVVAVVGFQSWFTSYQSGLNVKAESQSSELVTIDYVDTTTVYVKSTADMGSSSVTVNGGTGTCVLTSAPLTKGVNTFTCTGANVKGEQVEVVVVTPNGVASGSAIVR